MCRKLTPECGLAFFLRKLLEMSFYFANIGMFKHSNLFKMTKNQEKQNVRNFFPIQHFSFLSTHKLMLAEEEDTREKFLLLISPDQTCKIIKKVA